MSTPDSQPPIVAEPIPLAIDDLLASLDRLARTETSQRSFYAAVLDGLFQTVPSAAAAVWTVAENGRIELLSEIPGESLPRVAGESSDENHEALLRAICQQPQAQLHRPASRDATLAAVPVRGSAATKVIEVFLSDGPDGAAVGACVRLLDAVAEICDSFERNERLRELEGRESDRQRWERLVERFHASLDLQQSASCIANDGRHFLNCDRVSVMVRRGSRFRTAAISGMDDFHRRSPSVRLLETLAWRTAILGEAVWSDRPPSDLPPQIAEPLEAYQDESHVRTIGLVPLAASAEDGNEGATVGVLVVEQFVEPITDDTRRASSALARHAAMALANALQYSSLPGLSVSQAWQRGARLFDREKLPKTAVAAAVVLIVTALLLFAKDDFTVTARGTIEPLTRREVFAPADGVVVTVSVAHGQRVEEGEALLQIHDAGLDFELQRILGELQTARQRLTAVETERIGSSTSQRDQLKRITGEEEELKQLVQSLEQQYGILKTRRKQLTVLSPIGGEVMTWEVQQRLAMRPVRKGQVLLTVADTQGPWVLELELPEKDILHVRAAEEAGPSVNVDYVLATDSGVPWRGSLLQIAPAAQVNADGGRTVSIRARANQGISQATPGATAVAEIHCGRRALGYVWFRDVIEALQSLWR